jgi:enoyl-CoA hydratase/carnithine racemase
MTWKADDVLRGHDAYWQTRLYQETVQILEDLDAITIAKVDGVVTGGGLELTLVCDFVVATERSRWGMPEIDWGITPGWGGTSRLARQVGWRKAKEWNLIGALFPGEVAERHGLVNRLCAPQDLDGEVNALVEVMLEKNRSTLRRTKFIMNKGIDQHISASLAMEVAIMPYPAKITGLADASQASIADFQTKEDRERRRARSSRLDGRLAVLAGANANHVIERRDEDLAVPDLAGRRGLLDDVDRALRQIVVDDDLELDLREEVHHVLCAAIELRMALLAPEPPDLDRRHALDPDLAQGLLHVG